jgi:hypothetical protein
MRRVRGAPLPASTGLWLVVEGHGAGATAELLNAPTQGTVALESGRRCSLTKVVPVG